ncbi:hypothetical protein BDY24DRAFT_415663, partial [Mrakia frigida]|uniref:uncharacterized protein n=1 Tax=Mrakia frigida TaxID=29902 RepID=UPI003FCBF8DA
MHNQFSGGVGLLYKSSLPVRLHSSSSSDILVAELGDLIIIVAYLPPSSSRRSIALRLNPLRQLSSLLDLHSTSQRPILLLGDFNVRTGTLVANAGDPLRTTQDKGAVMGTVEGREMLEMAGDAGLVVLNGAVGKDKGVGRATSFQATRTGYSKTVIDYALISS